jgi:hypothetical protein
MKREKLVALMAVAMAVLAAPASASNAQVTRGQIGTFADGATLGYDVAGHVVMVRTPHSTKVSMTVSGLQPGVTYGSHVHNQSCAHANAGGHYSFGFPVPGGALDGSEIWPGPFMANAAGHANGQAAVGAVAGSEAVSVVVHAPGGAKIACADLS